MSPKWRVMLVVTLTTLAVDQASKVWAVSALAEGERSAVIDGFLLVTHVRNPGAAFGLLRDLSGPWRLPVFGGAAALAFAIIGSFFLRLAPGDRFSAGALALLLGGALGNFGDRLWRGEVIDLLHLRLWGGYPWPDFNLADVAIVVGLTGLMADLAAAEGRSRAQPAERSAGDASTPEDGV